MHQHTSQPSYTEYLCVHKCIFKYFHHVTYCTHHTQNISVCINTHHSHHTQNISVCTNAYSNIFIKSHIASIIHRISLYASTYITTIIHRISLYAQMHIQIFSSSHMLHPSYTEYLCIHLHIFFSLR